jgi:septal ring factor EnvC (AmiA/AmiB activator)
MSLALLVGCAGGPSQKELSLLDEQQQSVEAVEAKVAKKKAEKARLERKLASKKAEKKALETKSAQTKANLAAMPAE